MAPMNDHAQYRPFTSPATRLILVPRSPNGVARWRESQLDPARSASEPLQELDPVSERVARVEPGISCARLNVNDCGTSRRQSLAKGGEIIDHERRVGLSGRAERLLDSEVELD